MSLRVQHRTRFDYATRVELAAHMVHLRPRDLPWQVVTGFELRASPAPDRVSWGVDHFGNAVAWLFLDRAHDSLEILTESTVEVSPPPGQAGWVRLSETPAWERVAMLAQRPDAACEVAEFAFGSAMAPADPEARAFAAPSFPPARPVRLAVLDLMARIGREFRFQAGVTTVSTPVTRVLQLRAGVCQDFAHLMIAGLRSLGLPARYVSGYVQTRPPPGQEKLRGADQSHAWVSCWLGPAHGWLDLDPTNNLEVKDEHVWLGWGRDYADVSPVRGMLLGGGRHTLKVGVDIEPEDAAVGAG